MYDRLSTESKFLFLPGFLGSEGIGIRWFLLQICLLLCSIKSVRRLLLLVVPQFVILPLVAMKERKEIAGFTYLRVYPHKLSNERRLTADLGIAIADSHQGKGLGFELTRAVIDWAKEQSLSEITTYCLVDNTRAIQLFHKSGFSETRIIRGRATRGMTKHDVQEMKLAVNNDV